MAYIEDSDWGAGEPTESSGLLLLSPRGFDCGRPGTIRELAMAVSAVDAPAADAPPEEDVSVVPSWHAHDDEHGGAAAFSCRIMFGCAFLSLVVFAAAVCKASHGLRSPGLSPSGGSRPGADAGPGSAALGSAVLGSAHGRSAHADSVSMAANARTLVTPPRGSPYHKLSSGSCSSVGEVSITNTSTCQAAVQWRMKVHITKDKDRPWGCYLCTDLSQARISLWMSINAANKHNGVETSNMSSGIFREPLCMFPPRKTATLKVKSAKSEHREPTSTTFNTKGNSSGIRGHHAEPTSTTTRTSIWNVSSRREHIEPKLTSTPREHFKPAPGPAPTTTTPKPTPASLPDGFHRCTEAGQDCRYSRCCRQPGLTCFEKAEYWASCNATCTDSSWTCRTLGSYGAPVCSWGGATCEDFRCCKQAGYTCFRKDATRATCLKRCDNQTASVAQKGWSCERLGGSQGDRMVWKASPENTAGTSLFCFTVATVVLKELDGRTGDSEQKLVSMQRRLGLGIFGCNASAVFKGRQLDLESLRSRYFKEFVINVWREVRSDGRYKSYDWTVKVAPDAVFLPDRLRARLLDLRPPRNTPIYLRIQEFRPGLAEAPVILSRSAVQTYLVHEVACAAHLSDNADLNLFMRTCLDSSGVGYMADTALLSDKYANIETYYSTSDVTLCAKGYPVAFQPYKDDAQWTACHKLATGSKTLEDFVDCGSQDHLLRERQGNVCTKSTSTTELPLGG